MWNFFRKSVLKVLLLNAAFLVAGCTQDRVVEPASARYHPGDFNSQGSPHFHGTSANYHDPQCFVCHPVSGATSGLTSCQSCHNASEVRRCLTCHSLPLSTGSHGRHVDSLKMDCSVCHLGCSVRDSSVGVTHLDGIVNVNGALDGGTYAPASKSCSNAYCHGNFIGGKNPVLQWNVPVTGCNLCHNLPPATGAHTKHVTSQKEDCKICHQGYSLVDSSTSAVNHINHVADVDGPLSGGAFARTDTSCSNSYCHGNFIGGKNAKVRWNSGPLACNACHDVPATTAAHPKHVNIAAYNYDCNICHAGNSRKVPAVDSLTHADSVVNVKFSARFIDSVFGAGRGAALTMTNRSCSNIACHGYGYPDTLGVVWNRAAVPWSGTLSCTGCHNASGHNGGTGCQNCHGGTTSNGATVTGYAMHINGRVEGGTCGSCHALPPATGAHAMHADPAKKGYDCNLCHAGYSMKDSSVALSTHNNGRADVNGALEGGTYSGATKTCSNTYCHGNFTGGLNASVSWSVTLACGACHSMTPTSGLHSDNHRNFGCNYCHPGYVRGTTVDWTKHVNKVKDVGPFRNTSGAPDPNGKYTAATKTCSGLSCHGPQTWQ